MKKFFKLLLLTLLLIIPTGCTNSDNMEDITIYTSGYPIEFVTNKLYKDYSKIYNMYPRGIDITKYNLTKKPPEVGQFYLWRFDFGWEQKSWAELLPKAQLPQRILSVAPILAHFDPALKIYLGLQKLFDIRPGLTGCFLKGFSLCADDDSLMGVLFTVNGDN